MSQKPSVMTKCPANAHTGPSERIIEFSFPNGMGGLISFNVTAEGTPRVEVYRTDAGIAVLAPGMAPKEVIARVEAAKAATVKK